MAKKKDKSSLTTQRQGEYPIWICQRCAENNGGVMPDTHLATFHQDICDVCNRWVSVTEPRDYRYPKVKKQEDIPFILNELEHAYIDYVSLRMTEQARYLEEIIKTYREKLNAKKAS